MENWSEKCCSGQLKKINCIKCPVYFCSSSSLKESRLLWLRQLEFLASLNWSKIEKTWGFAQYPGPFPSDSVKALQEQIKGRKGGKACTLSRLDNLYPTVHLAANKTVASAHLLNTEKGRKLQKLSSCFQHLTPPDIEVSIWNSKSLALEFQSCW